MAGTLDGTFPPGFVPAEVNQFRRQGGTAPGGGTNLIPGDNFAHVVNRPGEAVRAALPLRDIQAIVDGH